MRSGSSDSSGDQTAGRYAVKEEERGSQCTTLTALDDDHRSSDCSDGDVALDVIAVLPSPIQLLPIAPPAISALLMTSAPFQTHHEPGLTWNGVQVSLLTTSAFFLLNVWLKRTGMTQPATTCKDAQLAWRWRNILISFIHSLISGIWAIYW